MEYVGKLYGKTKGIYFPLVLTSKEVDDLILKNKQANEFIKDIYELLNVDSSVIGFDDIQLTINDFNQAIKNKIKSKVNDIIDKRITQLYESDSIHELKRHNKVKELQYIKSKFIDYAENKSRAI